MLCSRDNPAFLAVVLICVFFLRYSHFGVIDYFPALETARMLTYPLLATAVAGFLLRPGDRFARWGLLVAAALSLETLFTVTGISWGANRAAIAGFHQLVRLLQPFLRATGMPYHTFEPFMYTLLTGTVYCVCARAFSRIRWSVLISIFVLSLTGSVGMILGLSMFLTGWFGEFGTIWVMLIHTILFWHVVVWLAELGQAESMEILNSN